jgi:DNA-binding NarL/FixJ family response regulator
MGVRVNIGSTLGFEESRAKRNVKARTSPVHYARTRMTPRLTQVLECIEMGIPDKETAQRLGVTVGTVRVLAHEIYRITGKGRAQLQREGYHLSASAAEGLPRMGAFE